MCNFSTLLPFLLLSSFPRSLLVFHSPYTLTGLSRSSLPPPAVVVADADVSGLFCLSCSVILPPAYAENINT